jgi:hypothetical protein
MVKAHRKEVNQNDLIRKMSFLTHLHFINWVNIPKTRHGHVSRKFYYVLNRSVRMVIIKVLRKSMTRKVVK